MILEEAEKIVKNNFIIKDDYSYEENLKSSYGNFYRFEVVNSLGKKDFIKKVEQFIEYKKNRDSLTEEYYKWRNSHKIGPLRVEFDLNSYLVAGVIPMKNMEEGYYLGSCRNSKVAYWDPMSKMFKHTKSSFNFTYIERIPHLEEIGYSFDLFIPIRKLDISEVDENYKIDKWVDGVHIKHKNLICV